MMTLAEWDLLLLHFLSFCLQCFNTVGLPTVKASGLLKLLLQNPLGWQLM